jgi:hypothetical protein
MYIVITISLISHGDCIRSDPPPRLFNLSFSRLAGRTHRQVHVDGESVSR